MKRPGIAILLNALVPGLGYLYAGMALRGSLVFGVILVLLFVSWRLSSGAAQGDAISNAATVGLGIAGILLPLVWMITSFQAGAFVETQNLHAGRASTPKRPVLAALLNLLPVGMGYLYLYRWVRGATTYLASIALILAAMSAAAIASTKDALEGNPPTAAVVALAVAIALLFMLAAGTALDAARIARRSRAA